MGEQVQDPGLVRLSEHPILDRIAQYVNIQVYDRDGGTSSPRIRLELRTKAMDAALVDEVLAIQTPCVRCQRPVNPFRRRSPNEGGAGRVKNMKGHVYIAIACPLTRSFGCCRGAEADHEYVAIRERVCKILGVDPESYSTKRNGSKRGRSKPFTAEPLPFKEETLDSDTLSYEQILKNRLFDKGAIHPRCPSCNEIDWAIMYQYADGNPVPPTERFECLNCHWKGPASTLLNSHNPPPVQPKSDEEKVDAFLATKHPHYPRCPVCDKSNWTIQEKDAEGNPVSHRQRYVCGCGGCIADAASLIKWTACVYFGCSCKFCGDGKGDHLCDNCSDQHTAPINLSADPHEPGVLCSCDEFVATGHLNGCPCAKPAPAEKACTPAARAATVQCETCVDSHTNCDEWPCSDASNHDRCPHYQPEKGCLTCGTKSSFGGPCAQCNATDYPNWTPRVPGAKPAPKAPPPVKVPSCCWYYRFPDRPDLTPMHCSLAAGHECDHQYLDAAGFLIMAWPWGHENSGCMHDAEHDAVVDFLSKYRKATRPGKLPAKDSVWVNKNAKRFVREGVPVCTVSRIVWSTMKINFTPVQIVVAYPAPGGGQYEHFLSPEDFMKSHEPKGGGKP